MTMTQQFIKKVFSVMLLAAFMLSCNLPLSHAASSTVTIAGPGDTTMTLVLADPLGSSNRSAALQQAISTNLSIIPFLNVLNSRSIPGGATVPSGNGEGIDFQRYLSAGSQLLITSYWPSSSEVEIRAFEVARGRFMFGNRYAVTGGENGISDVADKFCSDLLENLIGSGDLFRSTLAFIKVDGPRKRDVWATKVNGRSLRRLTNMRGEALSPAWSPDGRFVIFTHIDARSHALGVYNTSARSVQRIKFPGNTVIGPCFLPDNRVAVSLTDGRNPSIFMLDHSFQKQNRLDSSSAIDVSPSIDAKGSKMAFTSNRLGNPHIFLKDLNTGSVSRISNNGKYNTDPSISPDGTVIAFARQSGGGHRIFVYDLVTNKEQQVTFGPGSDEEPAFAPDGYFIAFMSTRGGGKQIYLTTRNGGAPKQIPTGPGDAAFPSWSPVPR